MGPVVPEQFARARGFQVWLPVQAPLLGYDEQRRRPSCRVQVEGGMLLAHKTSTQVLGIGAA